MKKYYMACILVYCITISRAQVLIADTNFVKWLNINIAGCVVNNMLDTTYPAVLSRKTIDCSANSITNLTGIEYFKGLDSFTCNYSSLSVFNKLPANLTYLSCMGDQLDSLPVMPSSLTYLNCSDNNFTSIVSLPSALQNLLCFGGQLTSLPELPATLTWLSCASNYLSYLPTLPDSLNYLDCSGNNLTYLPDLPGALVFLTCGSNQLTSLPTLPSSLIQLFCNNNQLSSLPDIPNSLTYILYCANNRLTSLPALPDSLNELNIINNYNLFCLPEIKKINSFSFSSTNIQCVPDYGTVLNSIPLIDTFPLCSAYNPGNCAAISGIGIVPDVLNSVSLFPNPTGNELHIDAHGREVEHILLYSMDGRLITENRQPRLNYIDVSALCSGVYIAEVRIGSASGRWKWVKI